MTGSKIDRKAVITDIFHVIKGGGCYISGDLVFTLIFRTDKELIEVCSKIHIKVTKC